MASKAIQPEYHVIDVIIVLISILITELISCLTSKKCNPSIQNLGSSELQSIDTTPTKNGKATTQSPSRSTKSSNATVDRKKAVGTGTKASPKSRTASSPRSRRSKPYLQYCEEYEVWGQPDLGLTSTDCNWDVDFSSGIAEHYPKERPHYC